MIYHLIFFGQCGYTVDLSRIICIHNFFIFYKNMLNIYIDLSFSKKKYITRDKVWIEYSEFLLKSLILFWQKFWGMIPSWNVSGKKQLKYSEGVHQVFKRSTSLVITKQFLQKSLYSQNLIPLVINVASQFNELSTRDLSTLDFILN